MTALHFTGRADILESLAVRVIEDVQGKQVGLWERVDSVCRRLSLSRTLKVDKESQNGNR